MRLPRERAPRRAAVAGPVGVPKRRPVAAAALMVVVLAVVGGFAPAPAASAATIYTVTATIRVGFSPSGVAVTPDGSTVYVTHFE